MTLEEYFGQGEYYFSESQQEMIPIEELIFPRLWNSCSRLMQDHGDVFKGTRLWNAFMERLFPSQERIRESLRKYGKASCVYWPEVEKAVRSRFYYAGRTLGVKVTTHKEKNWITATTVTQVPVKVRGEKVA